ncbi:Maltose-inducible porin [Serratia rubidaea]|uniref:Maltose-inducible porin n=1 Tax=Serratia rubidaea TaxID=61652 RepID=A0A3S4GB34_SERRU|nr:Maltose-inducible porin [Serratia rubidaea]
MTTLRKLPLALAVAAGVLTTQAMAVDFKGYARSGIGWSGSGGSSNASRPPAPAVNTASATNVKPMPS